ncbi:hypothetical protein SNE40_018763 [Patella caerulea]|uniref:H15 domain-containing protein n=1 Tax=Patella caerulea TaxID=87958 RepID=A0AAN8J614_PATCE
MSSDEENDAPIPKAKEARATLKLPTFYEMVTEALTKLDDRKGVSVQAIRAYITETYKSVDPNTMKYRMKVALAKGIEKGIFKRPKSSEDLKGATGRFKLDKTAIEASKKAKPAKKTDPASKANKKKTVTSAKEKKTDKAKVAKKKEPTDKSSLKTTKTTPAKTKSKSPKAAKKTPPKKTVSVKKVAKSVEAKPKAKSKAAAKKTPTKKEVETKKKTAPRKKLVQ